MIGNARKVFSEAMSLPVEERAELAAVLLASLDGEPEADSEEAWTAEITRRAERARAGATVGIDSATVHVKARRVLDQE